MSDCKPISSDVDALIEEMNALVVMEQDAADNAQNYMLPTWEDSCISLSEFCEKVHSRLDEYCSLSDSLKILEILNRYAKLDVEFFRELECRYGKASKWLKEFRFFEYSTVEHQRQDIWKLKEASPDAFVAVLRVASEVYRDLIPHPAMAHLALLRFYVVSLLDKLEEMDANGNSAADPVEVAPVVFAIGTALSSMEFCRQLKGVKSLRRLISVSSSILKIRQNRNKCLAFTDLAKRAWDCGCKLLHTQMFYLLKNNTKLIGDLNDNLVKNKLKECAPDGRKFGTGVKKIVNFCPCSISSSCPIINECKIESEIILPASTRNKSDIK